MFSTVPGGCTVLVSTVISNHPLVSDYCLISPLWLNAYVIRLDPFVEVDDRQLSSVHDHQIIIKNALAF